MLELRPSFEIVESSLDIASSYAESVEYLGEDTSIRLLRDEAGNPQHVARPCYYTSRTSFNLDRHLEHLNALNDCGVALPEIVYQPVSSEKVYFATRTRSISLQECA